VTGCRPIEGERDGSGGEGEQVVGVFQVSGDKLLVPTGNPLQGTVVYKYHWRPALERLGLPPVRLHDLRHRAAMSDSMVTVSNIVLSLLSGTGGALILDLWWKPRYARKRAAVLLRAEIQKNRDLLEDRLPLGGQRVRIWRDFMLPRIALDATVADLGHFPEPLAGHNPPLPRLREDSPRL
jgi:hypothetical protein